MRMRDDWPGALCSLLLIAWLGFAVGLGVFSQSGISTWVLIITTAMLPSPVVGAICALSPWLYFRSRQPRPQRMPSMPPLSRTVTAIGALVFVGGIGAYGWAIAEGAGTGAGGTQPSAAGSKSAVGAAHVRQDAELQRLQADFEEKKRALDQAHQQTARDVRALDDALKAPGVKK